MKHILLLVFVFTTTLSFAQDDQIQDALVFFDAKEGVDDALANPISIMTQDAIDRKAMHNVVIDARDVPVNEAHITTVKGVNGITVHSKSKWMNCIYVRGTQSDIEGLMALDFVVGLEFADPDLNSFAPMVPTPDKFALENQPPVQSIQYNYGTAANQIEQINAQFLHQHEESYAGADMVIAVMDSGFPNIDINAAFVPAINEGRLLGTYDFVSRQEDVTGTGTHGVRTFSDIGGLLDGAFVGTAPQASYYLYRTEDGPNESPLEEALWLEALERADSLGVDVVNTSLGYKNFDNPNYNHSYEDLDGETTIGARAGNLAFDKGMLLVTSGGNDGGSSSEFIGTPGDSKGILTIGSVTSTGAYSSFSSIGPTVDGRIKPDVMAQGTNAAVVEQFGNVTVSSGTSFSSPIMAGAVACLWQAYPELTNGQIMQIIRESAHLFDEPTNLMGYGIPNFESAFNAAATLSVEEQLRKVQFAVFPNPATNLIKVSFPSDVENAAVSVYNILGKEVLKSRVSSSQNGIDISSLSAGMYLVKINANNVSNSFKIFKQ